MICPFIQPSIVKVRTNEFMSDAITEETLVKQISDVKFVMPTKCQKAECGAWYNGHCNYKR